MARTLPAAFSTGIAATPQKPVILHKLEGLPVALYVTSGDDALSFDGDTYNAILASTEAGIGPELDWRGGLGITRGYALRITQGLAELSGLSGYNLTHAAFDNTWSLLGFDGTNRKAEPDYLDGDGSSCDVILVFDDGSPLVAESITVFKGKARRASYADHGELVVELQDTRHVYLDRTFVSTFGNEESGSESRATDRDLFEGASGQVIPILYGNHPYARAIHVHTESTPDDTAVSGLILCFSDARWACEDQTGTDPQLLVYDSFLGTDATVMADSLEVSATTQQYEYFEQGTPPESGGLTSGGKFVRFLDNGDDDGNNTLAAGGEILIQHGPFTMTPPYYENGATPATGNFEYLCILDEAFVYQNSGSGLDTSSGINRGFRTKIPELRYNGILQTILVGIRYQHIGAGTYKTVRAYLGGIGASSGGYAKDNTGATWSDTTDFHNIDGQLTSPTDAFDDIRFKALTGLNDDFHRIQSGWVAIGIYDPGASNTANYTTRFDAFYGTLTFVERSGWNEHVDKIYCGNAAGIANSSYHGGAASTALETPSDILYHFLEEVVGETGSVDTTAHSTAYADMSADGIKLALQIEESVRPREVVDKISMQSMSWLVPGDDGKERILYRPGLALSAANAEDPITESDIHAGTFSEEMTDEDEVYSGIILHYDYHWPTSKYRKQYRILPTAHYLSTNVSSATEYTALANAVDADLEKVLELKADYIFDDTTAEKVCKWYFQQHIRRRQICEFDVGMKWSAIQPGDVVPVVHKMVRKYSWATELTINHTTRVCTKTTGAAPNYPGSGSEALVEHPNDVLVVLGSGPNAGTWRITSVTNSTTFTLDSGHTLTTQSGTPEPAYIMPAQMVLSAQFMRDTAKGQFMRLRTIEFPILRAGATTF